MKVPNKVLDIVVRLAQDGKVSADERAEVLLWASEGKQKRDAARIDAARVLLAAAEK